MLSLLVKGCLLYGALVDGATLIGLILGIAGVLVGVASIWYARRPKRLGYVFAEWVPLLSSTYPGLEVKYQGVTIARPHAFTVRFKNYGKVEIRREDFDAEQPLQLNLGDRLIDVTSVEGEGLVVAQLTKSEHDVTIDPCVLNPGEGVKLTGLADLADTVDSGRHEVHGHIAGVASIAFLGSVGRWRVFDKRLIWMSTEVVAVLLGIAAFSVPWPYDLPLFILAPILFLIVFVPDVIRIRLRRSFR